MSNLALYRKYRSADFNEVVGQAHVVQVLENAIIGGRHSHAYLLTGPRGVGKTTVARIIAKKINKLNKDDDLADYLDIIEIDGASNRGIDEIRSLREKIILAPTKLKYKIYIIDEVHMLTKEAFNALLKTLEEPPGHAVFVFATTEVHKLPDTIISRTQRFDFRPIAESAMRDHLLFIAKQEKIKIDDEAIGMICKISRGGFRDAISLLDQLSAIDGRITISKVAEFSGLQDPSRILAVIMACSQNNPTQIMSGLKELFDNGVDVSILVQQLLDQAQDCLETGYNNLELGFLIKLIENLHWAQVGLKTTTVPKLLLQTALLRMAISGTSEPKPANNSHPEVKKEHVKTQPLNDAENDSIQPPKKESSGEDSKQIKALSVIKHYNNSLYAVLRGSKLDIEDDEIKIICRFSFHRDRIAEPRNTTLIEKAFSKVYGNEMHVSTSLNTEKKELRVNREQELMSSAMAILGGEVVNG